jgi:hypothetical protein
MAKYDNLWRIILNCSDQDQLPNSAWRQLKKIATAMDELEMSGAKLSMGEKRKKLLAVLGYDDKDSLAQLGRTERDLELLEKIHKLARKKYEGRMNPLYENERISIYDEATQKKKWLEGEALKQYVERIRKRLDIAPFGGRGASGKVNFEDILDNDDHDRVETPSPLIERYISALVARKGQIKEFEARQRKNMEAA